MYEALGSERHCNQWRLSGEIQTVMPKLEQPSVLIQWKLRKKSSIPNFRLLTASLLLSVPSGPFNNQRLTVSDSPLTVTRWPADFTVAGCHPNCVGRCHVWSTPFQRILPWHQFLPPLPSFFLTFDLLVRLVHRCLLITAA